MFKTKTLVEVILVSEIKLIQITWH